MKILLTSGESFTYLFDLNWQLIADSVLTLIAIFVLFLALSYFLFDPVRKMLAGRQEKVKKELEEAEDNMTKAKALREEYEGKMREVQKESESILSDARKKALLNENRMIEEAKEESARILAHARSEAELEKHKAADDVKKEMVTLASLMAGKVVAQSIDTTVQDGLIEETLKEMGEETWLS